MKIRNRIFLVFILVIGLGMLIVIGWLSDDLKYRYNESVEETLVDISNLLAESLGERLIRGDMDSARLQQAFARGYQRRFEARIFELEKTHVDMEVYVTDDRGRVIFHSLNTAEVGQDYSQWNDVARTLSGGYGARSTRDSGADDDDIATAYVAAPIYDSDRIVGVVSVGKPKENIRRFLDIARQNLVYAAISTAILVLMFGYVIYSWVSQPLAELALFADRVSRGERAEPPELGKNEIGDVGRAVQSMREALEGKEYTEQYVQTLTHELKSPLSAIRGAVELLGEDVPAEQRAQFIRNIQTESARMEDLVERMLQLASLEKRLSLDTTESIEMADLLNDIVQDFQVEILNRKLQVRVECEPEVRVRAEPFLIRQALSNLMQNAIDFSPQGGEIVMICSDDERMVEISVSDQGPGVPDYAIERIFDRFYSLPRPGSEQKSTGLGLNFVREAVELHGGRVQIDRENDTTRARIWIPRQ